MTLPKLYGPRGLVLLGFGVVSGMLGAGYASGLFGNGPSLAWLNSVVPLVFLGWVWLGVGVWQIVAAFQIDQSKPLGAFSAMCFLWGVGYAVDAGYQIARGSPPVVLFMVVIFWALTLACIGIGRMFNPGEVHLRRILKPGPPPPDKGGPQ